MLMDLVMALVEATTENDKEKAYRALERVGVDRVSAAAVAKEIYPEFGKAATK